MQKQNLSKELQVAIEAAKVGAKKALEFYKKDLETEEKEDKTILTKADKQAEETIKSYIKSQFPDANFVAERAEEKLLKMNFGRSIPLMERDILHAAFHSGQFLLHFIKTEIFKSEYHIVHSLMNLHTLRKGLVRILTIKGCTFLKFQIRANL